MEKQVRRGTMHLARTSPRSSLSFAGRSGLGIDIKYTTGTAISTPTAKGMGGSVSLIGGGRSSRAVGGPFGTTPTRTTDRKVDFELALHKTV